MKNRKVYTKKTSRAVGNRTNLFSDETSENPNEVQKIIEKLSEKIDTLTGRQEQSSHSGKEGSIRAIKDKKGNWFIEYKTADGWIKSDSSSASGFVLKNKKN